ncbi:E3 ubiquitin-protein ligase ctrip isoform X3 [Leptinotarsa decemlineata]|uniref:E3 ubiquitin-protein ligase ctrip isoform X3 n=1 Tax=Leptinotarsa decemlineata TaxID=7539 RepID=UPI003D30D4FC
MADPANTLAAASTSRRKRVLPTQPRAEAKRLRTSSQEDSSPDKKSQHNSSRNSHKSKSGKSGQSQEKKSDTSKPSTHQRSRSQEVPSTSSTSNKDRNSQIPNSKSKKHSKSDRDQAAVPEFEQKAKRNSRHSLDLNNHKQDPVDIYFRLNNSEPSGSSNLSVESRRSSRKNRKRSNSKETREDEKNSKVGKSNSLNNIKIETNPTEKTERSHRSHRKRSSSGFNSKNNHLSNEDDNPEASTSSSSSAFSQVHKYPLRSHSRTSVGHSAAPSTGPSVSVHLSRKSLPERGKRELLALGASSSQPTTRDAQEPSRLTRSGAVLRRSTRSSKGHSSTTGSCASSSGASGSGSSSRRAARQQKVGSAAPALLSAPATHAAAAMSADQPEVPNNGLSANDEPSSPQEAAQAVAPSGGGSAPAIDSESDDSEVGRLQALLEARGLPPHLFSALGPRMQQMLHRSMGTNNSVAKAQALIPGLQAIGDEGQQLQAVIEMCQILVMGNEEILTGFPVKQVVPPLTTLLGMEHNFDIMNHACRALTYMMEALPRSSAVVVDAVPVFLEKLQVIQCMDVAEQSLTALDMLSRRHSKAILLARGVSACLMYLDFFSINAQRNALSITANCCLNLSTEEFTYVQESLSLLASRLTQQDKKCVESVCLAFSRLVDSFHQDPAKLQEIASTELLTNLQQLLVVTPPIVSTGTFITVLRMLSVMCANCPDLALTLLKQNIAETLVYLLTGSAEINQDDVELIPRQPQEQFEITALIGELMPKLPTEGIFAVDSLLERPSSLAKDQPIWQWREDRGLWHTYSAVDSRIIEAAHMNGDDEVSLNSLGKIYTIDFHSMQQINEDTGTSRPVQRRFTPTSVQSSPVEPSQAPQRTLSASRDARVACLREERGLAAAFIRSLFSVLYEVYSSSAGPAVRFKCLRALLRMVYYANSELLRDVLKNQVVSSHIAGMMASSDLRIVVGALQMAEILMTKLPDEFGVHFRREGVLHQINRLADPEVPLGVSPPKSSCSSTSFSVVANESQPSTSQSTSSTIVHTANGSAALLGSTPVSSTMSTLTPEAQRLQESDPRSQSPSHVKFSDVLKRKRVAKRTSGSSRSKTRQEDMPLSPSLMQDLFTKATSIGNSTPSNSARQRFSGSSSKSSFLQSLNPARWGRSMNTSHDRNYTGNREKTRTWIREQASKFIESYSSSEDDSHSVTKVISRLKVAIDKLPTTKCGEALLELREILMESDISPFEVNYSGLITALLSYLADEDGPYERDQRLRIMLNVFAGCPFDENVTSIPELNPTWMSALVNKLNGCVSQLEQFPVKVHDFPASSGSGRGGTSALKFFNTHQLKCNLQRHPECTNLKQWKGGTVKIDPLALVQAIERYLVVRGYGRLRDNNSADSDDGDSDTDIEESLAGVVISQTGTKHKLQFLIGNNVLPYNMTVYQAVRQFSNNGNDQSETDTDNETPLGESHILGHAGIWVQTHVIYYRPMKEESTAKSSSGTSSSHSSRKGKGSSGKSTSRRKGDELWNEGITPPPQSPLTPFLMTKLPETVTIKDASLEVLCLLRILNSLNVYWSHLYPAIEYQPILPPSDFLNSKIAAKASRQLQDPLVIMTGNLPNWLQQIAMSCPFLFPFETRQLLFYATSFDRDRALQRLLDMSPELGSSDSQERVTPRLDRRKRTISREEILKQAEQVMQDMASSKALLEVQYENEVGTGLGPTLEFYALVSKEMQRSNLELWNAHNTSDNEFVHSPTGLFPIPLSRGAKVGQLTKVKSKFRFLGKFMAKAVMDSRMLDLPFSLTFYRWLLGQEHCLTLADLKYVSPEIYKTLRKMQLLVKQRDEILVDPDMSDEDKNAEVEKLEFDGCPIEDLGLDFIIPGHNIDLMKNGRSTHLTIHNLHLYVKLMSHWILHEGVSRQMESLREGFESVFPLRNLRVFLPEELESVFCGSPKDYVLGWDVKTLMECCRPDHGYTADSKVIRFLFEVLSSYDREEQRMFVQFLTGSPRLPVGGFKSLSPPLTVVRKTLEANMNPDDYLPSVMTCVNYLKLPEYSSIEVMREKLRIAASEGQHSFYLS